MFYILEYSNGEVFDVPVAASAVRGYIAKGFRICIIGTLSECRDFLAD